jgi:hypothetical protein
MMPRVSQAWFALLTTLKLPSMLPEIFHKIICLIERMRWRPPPGEKAAFCSTSLVENHLRGDIAQNRRLDSHRSQSQNSDGRRVRSSRLHREC